MDYIQHQNTELAERQAKRARKAQKSARQNVSLHSALLDARRNHLVAPETPKDKLFRLYNQYRASKQYFEKLFQKFDCDGFAVASWPEPVKKASSKMLNLQQQVEELALRMNINLPND